MTTRGDRYHSLDALRASMMLLGLVLHSAVNYVHEPLGEAWPYKDPNTSTLFDLLVFFIHLFRMPVFFVAAGFFGALLMERDGVRAFLVNRLKRVLVPLAIFWPIVFPLIAAGFIYANSRAGGQLDMTPFVSGGFLRDSNLAHLWFLWDLLLFYALAAGIVAAGVGSLFSMSGTHRKKRSDPQSSPRSSRSLRWLASVPGALLMGGITALTLLPMSVPGLDTSVSLLPPIRILVAYGVFFGFGWLLFLRRDLLEQLGSRWKLPIALGAAISLGYLILLVGRLIPDPQLIHIVGCVLAGLSTWLLIYGIVGVFVRKLSQPRPILRYLSDASYWMYIIHLPLAIGVPGLMAAWDAPAPIKFTITLTAVGLVTVSSYHYLVRSTAIGALLNGRRYPRALPTAAPARETITV